MTDPVHVPPPVFNFNAYCPAEIQEAVETVGVKKTNMPFLPSFTLAVVAAPLVLGLFTTPSSSATHP